MQLVPLILAIIWTIWLKGYFVTFLLVVVSIAQFYFYKKEPLPSLWKRVTIVMQLFWLLAAFLTNTSYITIGIILPLVALFFMRISLHKEQEKLAVISANYEQQMELLYELRKQRHDLQKHTSALLHARSEKHISELHTRYTQIDGILRGESNVVAGALYAYNEQAREKGVSLEYHIQHAISGLPLSEYELISFIGNILENSIDSAHDFSISSNKQGKILFSCRKQSGVWVIICKNDTLPLDDHIIERIYTSKSISTKTGNHEGIGTQEIMRIVKANKGTLDFSVIGDQFTLKIKIPDVRKPASL
ncbi:sensor histidine kinase [Lederbergia citri]|uniref:GHKL domain-containing protein n=1 Tax=Lederbergia citri TaxID=2833580 RepID=A0A942YH67_9BACI|nr:GHKL domain-containing protein [Lederbergia citri]MBS4196953.1 GHKL domain-containing protein [Lederbergia citri]